MTCVYYVYRYHVSNTCIMSSCMIMNYGFGTNQSWTSYIVLVGIAVINQAHALISADKTTKLHPRFDVQTRYLVSFFVLHHVINISNGITAL